MWWQSSMTSTDGLGTAAARNWAVARPTSRRRNSGWRTAVSGVSGTSSANPVPISAIRSRIPGATSSTVWARARENTPSSVPGPSPSSSRPSSQMAAYGVVAS